MIRLVFSLLFCVGLTTSSLGAAGSLQGVPADKFAAAGLHKLTAAELAELEQLIDDLRQNPRPVNAAEERKSPSWMRALITLQEVEAKPNAVEPVESQLVGDLSGWTGKTVFRLKNGQVWQQNDSTSRYDSPRKEPKVKIYPGMLGVYWMEFDGVKQRVKVKPVKLQ